MNHVSRIMNNDFASENPEMVKTCSTYLHTPPFSQKYSSPSWHNGPKPQSSPLNPGKHEQ